MLEGKRDSDAQALISNIRDPFLRDSAFEPCPRPAANLWLYNLRRIFKCRKAEITIETFEILKGKLPNRVLGLVLEWAALHRHELRADWERARKAEPLEPIQPLE